MPAATILYIEDDFQNRVLVRRILEAYGYAVVEAESGREGLKKAAEVVPDLILMDINLPEMDGYEATARLKKIETLDKVPIIAMTANVMKGDREKTLDAGCDGYIQKPIDVDRLPEQIEEFLILKTNENRWTPYRIISINRGLRTGRSLFASRGRGTFLKAGSHNLSPAISPRCSIFRVYQHPTPPRTGFLTLNPENRTPGSKRI